jgi:hypothetical protein
MSAGADFKQHAKAARGHLGFYFNSLGGFFAFASVSAGRVALPVARLCASYLCTAKNLVHTVDRRPAQSPLSKALPNK